MNDHRVLVAYSSRHGGTAEMAEWIAAELAEAGLSVDTRDVAAVDSLEGYDAVVLGSGVYMRSWRRDARRFLRRHRHELTDLRVWLFSSGPVDPEASVPNHDIGPGLARLSFQELPAIAFLKSGGPGGLFGLDSLILYACVAAGGVIGSVARYLASLLIPFSVLYIVEKT